MRKLKNDLSQRLWISCVFLITLTISFGQARKSEPISLKAASVKISRHLPAGCIVTAEKDKEATNVAIAGQRPPGDTPPEKRLFEIGSISKVFTSLLLAQAVEDKKLTLDTSLRQLLPNQEFSSPHVSNITLRQLATHTSGLPRVPENLFINSDQLDPYSHYDRKLLEKALSQTKLSGPSPQPWSYSNFAVGLLGDLLSRTYQKPWPELVQEKICTPLGMADTVVSLKPIHQKRFAPPYHGSDEVKPWTFQALAGAGALRSTASDLITFGNALLHPHNTPLAKAISLMIKARSDDGKHGLGIAHYESGGQKAMGHNGGTGGYRSSFEVFPESDTIRVILINNTATDPAEVLVTMRGGHTRHDRPSRKIDLSKMTDYLGVYLIENTDLKGSKFTVTKRDNKLWGKLTGQLSCRLHPDEKKDDRFFLREVPADWQFIRDHGKVTSMILHQNGLKVKAHKTTEVIPRQTFLTPEALAPYLGTYQLTPELKFKITAANGTLNAQLTGQQAMPVFQKHRDRFEYEGIKAALEFERNKQDEIIAVKLHQNGAVQRAPRN